MLFCLVDHLWGEVEGASGCSDGGVFALCGGGTQTPVRGGAEVRPAAGLLAGTELLSLFADRSEHRAESLSWDGSCA